MSEERKKVLEMLAEGKINAEEAERLLEKLDAPGDKHDGSRHTRARQVVASEEAGQDGSRRAPPKYLRVLIESKDDETVNIRVPLALVRTGILNATLPKDAKEKIEAKGIDLGQFNKMNVDELIQALTELSIDIDSSEGETVRIFCE